MKQADERRRPTEETSGISCKLLLSLALEPLLRDLAAVRDAFPRTRHPGECHDATLSWIPLWPCRDGIGPTRLDAAPALRDLLVGKLSGVQKYTARLSFLDPGGVIHRHTDPGGSLQHGFARLHLPIVTSPACEMILGGVRQQWRPGELWYADFTLPHEIHNRGEETRVHLVIDAGVNATLRSLFPSEFLRSVE